MIFPELVSLNVITEDWGKCANDFWIMLQANIGEKDEEGADLFTLYVTSPVRLAKILSSDSIKVGRGLLVMNDFNIKIIEEQIKKLLTSFTRETWDEVGTAINRYFYWEYEDYKE